MMAAAEEGRNQLGGPTSVRQQQQKNTTRFLNEANLCSWTQ